MNLVEATAGETGLDPSRIQALQEFAERMYTTNVTSAQVYAVIKSGRLIAHHAVGKYDPAHTSEDLDTSALFPLCSITKVYTATAVMLLVEQGLIGLNRPVCDYIPQFAEGGKADVRVHHLLTHTSGISPEQLHAYRDSSPDPIPPCEPNANPGLHQYIYSACGVPLTRKPGERMEYLGYGYELLAEIIRKISGLSYPQFMQQHLFEPLGLHNIYYNVPVSERHRIVRRAPEDACADWLENEDAITSVSAAGGLYATAYDVAVFAQMFLNGGQYNGKRILSPVSVREMTRNRIPGVASEYRDEYFPEACWGLGWSVNGSKLDGGDLFSPEAYSHWGAAGVFVAVDPVYDLVSVYFTVEKDLQKPFKNMYTDHFNNILLSAII